MIKEQEVVKLFKEHGNIKSVMDTIDVRIGWNTIRNILERNGIFYKNPRILIDSKVDSKIRGMVDQGMTYKQIADILNIKYITIQKHCKKNNIVPKTLWSKVDHSKYYKDIEHLAQKGESVTFIANKLGISRATVSIIAKKYSINIVDKTAVPLNRQEMIKNVEKLGYKVTDIGKKHNKNIITATHDVCNKERSTSYWDYYKHQCPHCSYTGTSKAEIEIKKWIESYGLKTEKIRINNKEIDIYIPERNIGIEYCGLYWHSEKFDANKKKHYEKMKMAEDNGMRLITIFEDEWIYRKKQVKNFVKSALNIHLKKIFARKCRIMQVEREIARIFLEENHIQGIATFEVAIGLYHDKELLGLITGNKHHRQGQNNIFVLNRLVFKDDTQIVGGASKLLKSLLSYAKKNGYEKLISWSDNRWSQGNVYKKTGFELTKESGPDYSYVNINSTLPDRRSKQSNKKKYLIKKGAKGNMLMTERDLALTLDLYRIWDCGKKRFEIKL